MYMYQRANKLTRPWHKAEVRLQTPHENRPYQSFYHMAAWTRKSLAFRKDHPLCELCKIEGRITPSEMTDHIVPINQGGDPWDESNMQALCKRHHNQKSAREKGRQL